MNTSSRAAGTARNTSTSTGSAVQMISAVVLWSQVAALAPLDLRKANIA